MRAKYERLLSIIKQPRFHFGKDVVSIASSYSGLLEVQRLETL